MLANCSAAALWNRAGSSPNTVLAIGFACMLSLAVPAAAQMLPYNGEGRRSQKPLSALL